MNWEEIHSNFLYLLAAFKLENDNSNIKEIPIIEIYKFSVRKLEKYLEEKKQSPSNKSFSIL
jgi:hypothetical protein